VSCSQSDIASAAAPVAVVLDGDAAVDVATTAEAEGAVNQPEGMKDRTKVGPAGQLFASLRQEDRRRCLAVAPGPPVVPCHENRQKTAKAIDIRFS